MRCHCAYRSVWKAAFVSSMNAVFPFQTGIALSSARAPERVLHIRAGVMMTRGMSYAVRTSFRQPAWFMPGHRAIARAFHPLSLSPIRPIGAAPSPLERLFATLRNTLVNMQCRSESRDALYPTLGHLVSCLLRAAHNLAALARCAAFFGSVAPVILP